MRLLIAVLVLLAAAPAVAAEYKVDYANSAATFSAKHAGKDFKGVFEDWEAEISFDSQSLETSKISAVFNMESAKTGNKMYDGALPQADWFDVTKYPEGKFESTVITKNQNGSYHMQGNLTLRDVIKPFAFDFTLEEAEGVTKASAAFLIDRLEYGVGGESDGNAEWVSKEIGVQLSLTASAQ